LGSNLAAFQVGTRYKPEHSVTPTARPERESSLLVTSRWCTTSFQPLVNEQETLPSHKLRPVTFRSPLRLDRLLCVGRQVASWLPLAGDRPDVIYRPWLIVRAPVVVPWRPPMTLSTVAWESSAPALLQHATLRGPLPRCWAGILGHGRVWDSDECPTSASHARQQN